MSTEPTPAPSFSLFDAPAGTNVLANAEPPEPNVEVSRIPAPAADAEIPATEEPAQPTEEEQAANPHNLTDDDLVIIKQDGKDVPVRWGDYKGHIMRMADYTRKTTAVANREREIESVAEQLAEREQRIISILRDPARLEALYAQVTGRPLTPPSTTKQPSDDELATAGDIRKTKDEVLAETRQEVERALQDIQEKQFKLQQAEFENTLRSNVEATMDAVIQEHAETLGKIPFVDAIIKKVAWADYQPKTIEEVKTAVIAAAKKVADQIAVRDREQKKVEVVKKATLAKGIEPAGGKPPAQQKKTYDKPDGKPDWDELDRDVASWIAQGGKKF